MQGLKTNRRSRQYTKWVRNIDGRLVVSFLRSVNRRICDLQRLEGRWERCASAAEAHRICRCTYLQIRLRACVDLTLRQLRHSSVGRLSSTEQKRKLTHTSKCRLIHVIDDGETLVHVEWQLGRFCRGSSIDLERRPATPRC